MYTKINPIKYLPISPLPYNQHDTNHLLHELQLSIKDVQETIQKSKLTLGYKSKSKDCKGNINKCQDNQDGFKKKQQYIDKPIGNNLSNSITPPTEKQPIQKYHPNSQQRAKQQTLLKAYPNQINTQQNKNSIQLNKTDPLKNQKYKMNEWQIKQSQVQQQNSSNEDKNKIYINNNIKKSCQLSSSTYVSKQKKYFKNHINLHGKSSKCNQNIAKNCIKSFKNCHQGDNKLQKNLTQNKQLPTKKLQPKTLATSNIIPSHNQKPVQNKTPDNSKLTQSTKKPIKKQNPSSTQTPHLLTDRQESSDQQQINQLQYILLLKLLQQKNKKRNKTTPSNSLALTQQVSKSIHHHHQQQHHNQSTNKKNNGCSQSPITQRKSMCKCISKQNNDNAKIKNRMNSTHSYIQKYLNSTMYKPKQFKKKYTKNKTQYTENNLQKNIHKQILNNQPQTETFGKKRNGTHDDKRQIFINQMKNKCYVNRFLTTNQLNKIYDQFNKNKIMKAQWNNQIVQQIFNKIYHTKSII